MRVNEALLCWGAVERLRFGWPLRVELGR